MNRIYNFVIADDDPDDQFILQKMIWGFNVHHKITAVYNGSQLLDYLLREGTYSNCEEPLPDCIFLDFNMPLLNGGEVLQKIRAENSLKTINVHILTGAGNENEKMRLLNLGANGYFTKQSDSLAWRKMIESVIRQLRPLSAKL